MPERLDTNESGHYLCPLTDEPCPIQKVESPRKTVREATAKLVPTWLIVLITGLVVATVIMGIGLVLNWSDISSARNDASEKSRELIVKLQHEQVKSCERSNQTNDGIRSILDYLDQRREQGSTPQLTPEQSDTELHVRALIPAHQACKDGR